MKRRPLFSRMICSCYRVCGGIADGPAWPGLAESCPRLHSRAHLRKMLPVIDEALSRAGVSLKEIGCIAVHNTPGLVGALLIGCIGCQDAGAGVGCAFDSGESRSKSHLRVPARGRTRYFPVRGLVVSGGHTALFQCDSPLSMTLLGGTRDDAAGEGVR